MSDFTRAQAEPVLALIRKHESRGDYGIVYGGIAKDLRPKDLQAMTISEVQSWQNGVVRVGAASSAAGAYQIIRKTLESLVTDMGIPTSDKFGKDTQDKMGMQLLRRRGFGSFISGIKSHDDMAIDLAKEWASMPVPKKMRGASRDLVAGQSYYAGDGLNKAHATVAEVMDALSAAKNATETAGSSSGNKSIASIILALLARIFGVRK